MPIPLLLLLFPLTSALGRMITGAATAGIIYYFLKNTAQPYFNDLSYQIMKKVSEFSTVGGTVLEVIHYFDFPNLVSMLLSCMSACFTLKLMSIAIRAFGINTG